jgi:hypothetical protein
MPSLFGTPATCGGTDDGTCGPGRSQLQSVKLSGNSYTPRHHLVKFIEGGFFIQHEDASRWHSVPRRGEMRARSMSERSWSQRPVALVMRRGQCHREPFRLDAQAGGKSLFRFLGWLKSKHSERHDQFIIQRFVNRNIPQGRVRDLNRGMTRLVAILQPRISDGWMIKCHHDCSPPSFTFNWNCDGVSRAKLISTLPQLSD